MRILEPEKTTRGIKVRAGNQYGPVKNTGRHIRIGLYAVVLVAVVGIVGTIGYFARPKAAPDTNAAKPVEDTARQQEVAAAQTSPMPTKEPAKAPGEYREFTGEEFRVLYNNFSYPGTKPIVSAPVITGNESADQRLRAMAENRGYRLRDLIFVDMNAADNQRLHPDAAADYLKLKAAASADGINLIMTSGYRSPEEQRSLFLSRLYSTGASSQTIAAGKSDNESQETMEVTAPPGYSRHHTGYVMDLSCGNKLDAEFVDTVCYDWISKNNYINAKKFGWIPSYPQDTVFQGPEPEPWEYVWVGADVLR